MKAKITGNTRGNRDLLGIDFNSHISVHDIAREEVFVHGTRKYWK